MLQRCAALGAHAASNEALLRSHRTLLDEVHAHRREQAAAVGEEYVPPHVARASSRARTVEEGSRWMAPAMYAAAVAKAKVDDRREEVREGLELEAAGAEEVVSPAREGPGRRPMAPPTPPAEGPTKASRPSAAVSAAASQASRPSSAASSAAAQRRRPGSAGTARGAKAPRPSSSTTAGASRRGSTAASAASSAVSWSSSRPASASSLRARCRALEEAAERNGGALRAQRQEIEKVVKTRQEQADKLARDFVQEVKAALGMPTA